MVREGNIKIWEESIDIEYFGVTILAPEIENPAFEGGQYTEPHMALYVKPVLDLLGNLFCTRCRTPHVAEERWKACGFASDQGQPTALLSLPINLWGKIFGLLGVHDTWACKLTCLGLYGLVHLSKLKCKWSLNIEAEKISIQQANSP